MKNFILIVMLSLGIAGTVKAVPALNSYPSATATIYLDFDGETVTGTLWNNGSPLVCSASGMTDAQITEVFNRVAEDYRPFNVNITTDINKYLAAPLNKRVRVIITPTSSWRPGVGGIAFVGSFTWGDDTPCFIFCDRLGPNNPKYVAECCSHESGHTLGLSHQSTYDSNCQLVETYAMGTGTGETSWAPIMGNSYYRNMTGWDFGPTPYGCTAVQDNLTIITTQNGFSYRTDDYVDAPGNTSFNLGNTSFSASGIMSTNTDKDAFRFDVAQAGQWHLEAIPYGLNTGNSGSNLDIKMELYNTNKVLIRTYDPLTSMKVTVDTTLPAGTYYIVLTGTGNTNVDDYGSLGSYTLTGLKGALPIHDVALTGNTNSGRHNFNWNIVSDEPISTQVLEYSTDGADFMTLATIPAGQTNYSYTPQANTNLYYRLKVTSVVDQTVYSNIIALRSPEKNNRLFLIPTLVSDNISITASENYQYRLADVNGRILATGNGIAGANRINMMNKPGGMYILQIFSANERRTERIIKQ